LHEKKSRSLQNNGKIRKTERKRRGGGIRYPLKKKKGGNFLFLKKKGTSWTCRDAVGKEALVQKKRAFVSWGKGLGCSLKRRGGTMPEGRRKKKFFSVRETSAGKNDSREVGQ